MSVLDEVTTPWENPPDLLHRQEHSKFLTKIIESKTDSYVLNLNASWGFGKTFFLSHWAKSLQTKHPVVYVNAWESDFSDDPLLAVMSAIDSQLIPKESNEERRKALLGKVGSFFKAVAPAVIKGMTKKALGGDAFNDIGDAVEGFSDGDKEVLADIASTSAFHLLAEHKAREQSISDFREALESLVNEVCGETNSGAESDDNADLPSTPAIIYVDELDRCRPSYAVEMLENIKHLFSVPGVVFIIATDTVQLQHSVCAVYGVEFGGYEYLRRFFDQEFTLPEPSRLNYARSLTREVPVGENLTFASFQVHQQGPDGQMVPGVNMPDDKLSLVLAFVSDSLSLSLRSTNQVWHQFKSIVTSQNRQWDVIFLLFLLGLQICDYKLLDLVKKLSRPGSIDDDPLRKAIRPDMSMRWLSTEVFHSSASHDDNMSALSIVLGYTAGLKQARSGGANSSQMDTVRTLPDYATYCARNTFYGNREDLPALISHFDAVELAGYLRT